MLARPPRGRSPATSYKLHAAVAVDVPIVTAISVSPGNEHDDQHAGALVDQQAKQRRPRRVIGDTAYGNVEAREQLEQRSVAVLAPVHSTSPKDGTLPKDAFQIDLDNDTVSCPQGKTTPIYKKPPSPQSDRRTRRAVCPHRLRALPTAASLRAWRPARHPHPPARRPTPSRAARLVRSRRARAPQPHQTPHRTAPRTDRLPLPRTQQPLPRSSKIDPPSRLDCHPGQPPPHRSSAPGANGITPGRLNPGEQATDTPPGAETRIRTTPFLSGLATIQHSDGPRGQLALCHGLSRLAAAGGRLVQPGDAQAEPLEAGASAALLLPHGVGRPPAGSDRPLSADRAIGMRGRGSRSGRQPHDRIRFGPGDPVAIGLPRFR